MLKNPDFEGRPWTDIPTDAGHTRNQQPFGWKLSWLRPGQKLWDSEDLAQGEPEAVHKLAHQLPENERYADPPLPTTLILKGETVYKMFNATVSFGVELYQEVSGLKPGSVVRVQVPVRIHQHQKKDDPPPADFGAESGVWLLDGDMKLPGTPDHPERAGKWRNARERNFKWYWHIVEANVPASGKVGVLIRVKAKYPPVDFFIDNIEFTAVAASEPEPTPPPPPPAPVPQRGKPREQYKRTYVLLPPTAADPAWAVAAASATVGSRFTVGYSADDAFVGDLDQRHVIAVNAAGWGTGEDGKGLRGFGVKYYGLDTVAGLTYEEITAVSPQELFTKLGGKGTSPVPFEFRAWPTDHKLITQAFGANPATYKPFGLPGHEGIDVRAPHDSPVYAVADGTVYAVGDDRANAAGGGHNYGVRVYIRHGSTGYRTAYAHLNARLVSVGNMVKAGQMIGRADNTGNSFGSHLHLTLYKDGASGNGYPLGIVDPTPFLQPLLSGYTGPAVTFISGLDQPGSDWQWQVAKVVFDQTKLAPKFHTAGDSHKWYSQYKHPGFNIVRVVIDRGFNVRNADAIFGEVRREINKYWGLGARDFILLNEPNIDHEHLGKLWDNGAQFGDMFRQVSERVRVNFPGVRIWTPGFSPQWGAQHQFIAEAQAKGLFTHVHGVVEHVYSGTTSSAAAAVAEMVAEVRDFQQRWARTRPLVIGEFSVNRPAPALYKAQVYKAFYAELAKMPGIQAAYSFTSSWAGNPDHNQEGWLEFQIAGAYRTL